MERVHERVAPQRLVRVEHERRARRVLHVPLVHRPQRVTHVVGARRVDEHLPGVRRARQARRHDERLAPRQHRERAAHPQPRERPVRHAGREPRLDPEREIVERRDGEIDRLLHFLRRKIESERVRPPRREGPPEGFCPLLGSESAPQVARQRRPREANMEADHDALRHPNQSIGRFCLSLTSRIAVRCPLISPGTQHFNLEPLSPVPLLVTLRHQVSFALAHCVLSHIVERL